MIDATHRLRGPEFWRLRLNPIPEFQKFVTDVWVELLGQSSRRTDCLDEFLDISQVLQPIRVGHARGEFQFDKSVKTQIMNTVDLRGCFGRIRKGHRLRFAIAGNSPEIKNSIRTPV